MVEYTEWKHQARQPRSISSATEGNSISDVPIHLSWLTQKKRSDKKTADWLWWTGLVHSTFRLWNARSLCTLNWKYILINFNQILMNFKDEKGYNYLFPGIIVSASLKIEVNSLVWIIGLDNTLGSLKSPLKTSINSWKN